MSSDQQRFSCAHCNGDVWLTGNELPAPRCPHCGGPMGFVELTYCDVDDTDLASRQTVNLSHVHLGAALIELIPEAVARGYSVVPLSLQEDVLTIAIPEDACEWEIVDRLRFILARRIRVLLASRTDLEATIDRCYP